MDSLQPKMNYYNTGFIGGFLYNLKVEAMDQPRAIQNYFRNYSRVSKVGRGETLPSNEQQILCLS